MPRAAAGGAKKAGPKAHKLAEQFPKDLVLRDLCKKEWLLGDVVGRGGFGLIYLASEKDSTTVKGNKDGYVVKIEPKSNGPLFCEVSFYQRVARLDQIQEFIRKQKLQYLPVPPFIGNGSHEYKSNDYRFLVMPRLGTDLQKLLVQSGGTFPAQLVFAVALRILDALQYLHTNEYVHADIKAANILQGYRNGKMVTNEVHLVDYGLAYRYIVAGVHKEYKEDPRKAHDGTIEFTSRDAHKGVSPSRRADLEITGYCLMQWLCGKLPWENKLSDPVYVAGCKEKFMANVSSSVSSCFTGSANPNSAYKDIMVKFLGMVTKLKYDEGPDYNLLKSILQAGLKKTGHKNDWTLDFAACNKGTKRKSTDGTSTPKKSPRKAATPKKSPGKAVLPKKSPRKAVSPKKTKAATVASPRGKKKPSPKKRARIVTPMTPKSPVPVTNGSSSSLAQDTSSTDVRAKKVKTSAKPKAPTLDTPLTRNLTNGDGGDQGSNSASKQFPMPAPSGSRSPAAKNPPRRRIKRVGVVQNDASIQTSPSLAKKSKSS